jgi:hypothetical protein
MNFDYEIENEDGEVLATVQVEVQFSPYVPAFTSGLPEDCYPAEGGEIENLWVYLDEIEDLWVYRDGEDITKTVDATFKGDHYDAICNRAYDLYDAKKEDR